MTIPNNRIITLAVKQAKLSSYSHRVGCVIFKKSKIFSIGYNSALKSRKKLNPIFQKWQGSIHAEVDSIINARMDLKGCDLLVVRINRKDEFRLSKPCLECQKYIDYVGIRKVYFSINSFPHIVEL